MKLKDLLDTSEDLPRKLTELLDYELVMIENGEYGSYARLPVVNIRINTATKQIMLED